MTVDKSLYHSLTPKKANGKRTLVLSPVIGNYVVRNSLPRAGALFLQVVQRAVSDSQPLSTRHNGRVVIGDQSPAPMLLYPHSGKASVMGNCVAFILPIHC